MSTKKVIVQLDKEKLSEYLGIDVQNEKIKLSLTIPDDKKNLKALMESRVIVDWDYYEGGEETEEKEKANLGILSVLGIEKDYNKIAWVVESVWKLSQKSPNLLFLTDPDSLFVKAIREELKSTDINSEHTIITLLCEIRYGIWDIPEIDKDLTEKLQNNWHGMRGMTLTDLAKEIYER